MRSEMGATLIELVLVIVVIAASATIIFSLVGQSNQQSAQTFVQNQARIIANATMTEVLNKPVFDPDDFRCNALPNICPVSAETSRLSFDNVCDFNGYDGEPVNSDGSSLGLDNYRVVIDIDAMAELNGITNAIQPNLLKIIVTVTDPTGASVSLTGWRFALERLQC